jgi:Leucine-rich repeat (LRR) protein
MRRFAIFITLFFALFTLVFSQDNSCFFIGCKCTKNFDDSYDILCIGDEIAAQDDNQKIVFPKRVENASSPQIPLINTFLIKKFPFRKIPDLVFRDLRIRNLVIGENELEILTENAFRGIKSLGLLRVIEKNFERIEPFALMPISDTLNELGLWQINFNSEFIGDFFAQFKQLKSLKTINIMGYGLKDFKYEWTEMFENISSLNLASNDLRDIRPDLFRKASNLLVLDLSNNFLENLTDVFQALRPVQYTLKELKITGNSIEHVVNFPKFPNLEILDLSFNKIKRITDNSFYSLPKLSNLYLGNNLLEEIERDTFKYSKSLKIVLLSNNMLKSIPKIATLSKLKILDMVNQNGQLKTIDDYSFERIETPHNSLSIHLDFNDIHKVGNRTFCSRYYNQSEIFNLDMNMKSVQQMNKCVFRQLSSSLSTKVYLNIGLNQIASEKHSDLCNCDFRVFANIFKIELVGSCGQMTNKCEASKDNEREPVQECDRNEFKCD